MKKRLIIGSTLFSLLFALNNVAMDMDPEMDQALHGAGAVQAADKQRAMDQILQEADDAIADQQKAQELRETLAERSNEDRESFVAGAASHCMANHVKIGLESLHTTIDEQKANKALFGAILSCTNHANGPTVVRHLARYPINLNVTRTIERPVRQQVSALHEAAGKAAESGNTALLETLLDEGVDTNDHNTLPGHSLSTVQVYQRIVPIKAARQEYPYADKVLQVLERYVQPNQQQPVQQPQMPKQPARNERGNSSSSAPSLLTQIFRGL